MSAESANQFGELVADPITNEVLHYTEKPETFVSNSCYLIFISFYDLHMQPKHQFHVICTSLKIRFLLTLNDTALLWNGSMSQVSDLINCGVYVFTPDIFTAIQDAIMQRNDRGINFILTMHYAKCCYILSLFSWFDMHLQKTIAPYP